ncbi:MAG: GDSL-type esterase/lipase family protein [Candidatus Nanohaloarchaea archaeon]
MDDILVFGHSITKGMWDIEGGWVQRLENFLNTRALETQEEENICYVYNLGVSGDTTEHLLKRLEEEYRRRTEERYDTLLMIQIGANDTIIQNGDVNIGKEEFEANFEQLLKTSKRIADEVIVVGDFPVAKDMEEIPYAPDNILRNEKVHEYEDIKEKVTNKHDIEYIDLFKTVKEEKNTKFLEEGVHPTSEGHKLIFQEVKERLEEKELI